MVHRDGTTRNEPRTALVSVHHRRQADKETARLRSASRFTCFCVQESDLVAAFGRTKTRIYSKEAVMYKLWIGAALAMGLGLGACKDGGGVGVDANVNANANVGGEGAVGVDVESAAGAEGGGAGGVDVDVSGVESAAADKGPKSGETYISLTLSGGHLTEPLVFEGMRDLSPSLFDTSTSILAQRLDVKASKGDATLKQFVVSIDSSLSGPVDVAGNDLDIVFIFPEISKSLSLRPILGSGGVDLDLGNGDRATVKIHFDAAPTQMSSKDMRFRLEGVIDSRKRK